MRETEAIVIQCNSTDLKSASSLVQNTINRDTKGKIDWGSVLIHWEHSFGQPLIFSSVLLSRQGQSLQSSCALEKALISSGDENPKWSELRTGHGKQHSELWPAPERKNQEKHGNERISGDRASVESHHLDIYSFPRRSTRAYSMLTGSSEQLLWGYAPISLSTAGNCCARTVSLYLEMLLLSQNFLFGIHKKCYQDDTHAVLF